MHLPYPQVVTVEVTVSLALSLGQELPLGGQAFPEQARGYLLMPLAGGASYQLGGLLGEVWGAERAQIRQLTLCVGVPG